MSKVISVLEKMASDAAMNSESTIADLVAKSEINDGQQQAILANDVEGLVENTVEIPLITNFIIAPAEDDEPSEEDNDESSKSLLTANRL
jgi:hypothetical protein